MKNGSHWRSFVETLWDRPVYKVFTVLDVIGLIGVVIIVIDDPSEAITVFSFLAILVVGIYLIFAKQQTKITELQQRLGEAVPDIVPMPIELPDKFFRIRLRNEGQKSARSITLRINCQDSVFSAEKGSLMPAEEISLDLQWGSIGPVGSKAQIDKMMSDDQTAYLHCEFADPFGTTYATNWECEWGKEWSRKNH